MKRLFLLLLSLAGLSSCSSVSVDGEDGETAQKSKTGNVYSLNQKNPFEWSDEDVQKAQNGMIEGGKRSQYESAGSSRYSNQGSPSFLNKSYTKQAWSGGKNYSTGSYTTGDFNRSAKQSRYGSMQSGEDSKVSRASGQGYNTGSYRTGSAREAGRSMQTGANTYVESRRKNYGWVPPVYGYNEHPRMSVGEAKSLLGR